MKFSKIWQLFLLFKRLIFYQDPTLKNAIIKVVTFYFMGSIHTPIDIVFGIFCTHLIGVLTLEGMKMTSKRGDVRKGIRLRKPPAENKETITHENFEQ